MKTPLDTKSVCVGLLLGVLITVSIAATANSNALSGPVGRYQIEASEHRTHIIDTVTGQIWSNSSPNNSGSRDFYGPKLKNEK